MLITPSQCLMRFSLMCCTCLSITHWVDAVNMFYAMAYVTFGGVTGHPSAPVMKALTTELIENVPLHLGMLCAVPPCGSVQMALHWVSDMHGSLQMPCGLDVDATMRVRFRTQNANAAA